MAELRAFDLRTPPPPPSKPSPSLLGNYTSPATAKAVDSRLAVCPSLLGNYTSPVPAKAVDSRLAVCPSLLGNYTSPATAKAVDFRLAVYPYLLGIHATASAQTPEPAWAVAPLRLTKGIWAGLKL